jgi:hypothetical protein
LENDLGLSALYLELCALISGQGGKLKFKARASEEEYQSTKFKAQSSKKKVQSSKYKAQTTID